MCNLQCDRRRANGEDSSLALSTTARKKSSGEKTDLSVRGTVVAGGKAKARRPYLLDVFSARMTGEGASVTKRF